MSVTLEYRVIYGDTDMMGVMYHANYLRLFEAGRAEFSRKHGLSYKLIEEAGVMLPVIEANMKYLRPALFDELVTVHVWLKSRSRIKLEFGCRIMRGDEELARGWTVHACLDRSGRPQRLPAHFEKTFPITGENDDQPPA